MMSVALRVAFSMAAIRAACSAASESARAFCTWTVTARGTISAKRAAADGSKIGSAREISRSAGGGGRKEALPRHLLHGHRDKAIEKKVHLVRLFFRVFPHQAPGQLLRDARNLPPRGVFDALVNPRKTFFEKFPALFAHQVQVCLLPLGRALFEKVPRGADGVLIKGAAEAAVCRNEHQLNPANGIARRKQRMSRRRVRGQVLGHLAQALAVDARPRNAFLGASKLRRRDELHGPRNLARLVNALDALRQGPDG